MNDKVKASFACFFTLLLIWITLAEWGKPELGDILTLVKGATFTSWTACALFFETDPAKPAPPAT